MSKKNSEYEFMQNRELSWLRFNERVLHEAKDTSVPLLERFKYLSIFTSNLDEFFMIRVGSLYDLASIDNTAIDNKTGLSPSEQLDQIYDAVISLYQQRDDIYHQIIEELSTYGISALSMTDLNDTDRKIVKKHFKRNILPFLSPQIVDRHHPFPHLINKDIHIVAYLQGQKNKLLGIIPIPYSLPDVLFLPGNEIKYVYMEQIIVEYVESIFGMYEVLEKTYLCVTRNADITADDDLFDESVDFRLAMKKILSKRNRLSIVRLEVASNLSNEFEDLLFSKFEIKKEQRFVTKSPMKLDYVFSLVKKLPLSMRRALYYPDFESTLAQNASLNESIFKQIRKKDYLYHHPFESMDFFLNMIKEAATDPKVISIKMTIYRLARKAKLVEYLSMAAENGKEVTVIIELRARFDEQNNIDWSERLEEAGCRVIYGFDEYKVHSKVCLITYRYKNTVTYITQIGTGNYNESTVNQYTDLSLFTANQEIGHDAAEFFKNMSIGTLDGIYTHFLVAPSAFKPSILRLIEREMLKKENGRIVMKLNSITDKDIILALSEASCAGAKIDLIVRGICCILPQVFGATDNITVTSIVGRFLEHSRIYRFGNDEDQLIFISSADLMTRNTERRIEVACPILDNDIKNKINHILDIALSDNTKARNMLSNGQYERINTVNDSFDSQEYFMEEASIRSIDQKITGLQHELGMWDRLRIKLIDILSR